MQRIPAARTLPAPSRGAWRVPLCALVAAVVSLLSTGGLLAQGGPDFLTAIDTLADFEAVSVDAPRERRITKYLVPARDDPELLPALFQNVSRYPFHFEFLRDVFPDRFAGLTFEEYRVLVERRATRRYFAGSLARIPDGGGVLYGFSVFTDPQSTGELPSREETAALHARLVAVFGIAELYYAPDTDAARAAAREWGDTPFPIYFERGGDEAYVPYTIAVGYGRVRRMTLAAFEEANASGRITFQDVLVLERAPSDIEGVVGGVITAERQGDLSHVQIRTARRGTPNAYVKDALRAFASFDGKLVRIEVEATGYRVEEASPGDAEEFWEGKRPTLGRLPVVDEDYARLDALDEIDLSGPPGSVESRVGGKAANLARLGRVLDGELAAYREPGFAIPVRYYLDFMRSNRVRFGDRELTYEELVLEVIGSPAVESDAQTRFELLAAFREEAREEGVVSAELVARVAERIENVFGSRDVMVRFRSSSNAEDLLEFHGAGLYESTSACAADGLDDGDEGPSACDARQPEARTIARALKKVWTSLWTFRAYEERSWFGIPPERAAMGILVTGAFLDEEANGVAFTGNPASPQDDRYVVTAQLGEESVVSPEPGVLPERTLLLVDRSSGALCSATREQASTLLPRDRVVLSDAQLAELGRVLWQIDAAFPLDLAGREREEVLLDVEFKIDGAGALAVKQVRPYLLGEPPPRNGPELVLEVPAGTVLCGGFAEGRPPIDELNAKGQLELRAGRHLLPTDTRGFRGDLIEELLLGPQEERATPRCEGFFRLEVRVGDEGDVVYSFGYEQSFALASGETVQVTLDFLDFTAPAGGAPPEVLTVDEAFITESLFLEAVPGGDRRRLVRFSSCDHASLPRWRIEAELEDGTTVLLAERFRPSIAGTAPAALESARIAVGGDEREIDDYWRLVYAAQHHNLHVRYLVLLDPPLTVLGAGEVHALELAEPKPDLPAPAEALYRGADLEVIARRAVRFFERCLPPDCATAFRRGDADGTGRVEITDAVVLANTLLLGGPPLACADAGDFDDDGAAELTDVVLVLTFLFNGVDLSAPPGPLDCGRDPSADALAACRDPGCV